LKYRNVTSRLKECYLIDYRKMGRLIYSKRGEEESLEGKHQEIRIDGFDQLPFDRTEKAEEL
jgi:hypothetical protein